MGSFTSSLKQSHSGDELSAFSAGNSNYIKKLFKSKNQRIIESINKQNNFKIITTPHVNISSVEIIEENHNDNDFSILMPYIDGISGAEYALYGDREIGAVLSTSMNQLIITELLISKNLDVKKQIFKDKIKEISSKINIKKISSLLKKVENDLKYLPDYISIPIGPCHGDLTLSNIICSRYQGIKLIDFLSVYIESPLQDASKIIQDYYYGWSFRHLSKPERIKGSIFLKNEIPDIIGIINEKYKSEISLFTRLTLLRIAPYLKDTTTEEWLIAALENYIEITDERS